MKKIILTLSAILLTSVMVQAQDSDASNAAKAEQKATTDKLVKAANSDSETKQPEASKKAVSKYTSDDKTAMRKVEKTDAMKANETQNVEDKVRLQKTKTDKAAVKKAAKIDN